MQTGLTVETLRTAVARVYEKMEACRDELNALDGQLGDGDLGITMVNGFRRIQESAGDLPGDVGMALMKCAQALTRAGGSSYATLLATGFMAAAKAARGREIIAWDEVPALLAAALEQMGARGKSSVGDKTVLDAVDAAREGVATSNHPAEMAQAANAAIGARLDALRALPCKQGRARIFAEKSKGMDDPGMVALKRMVEALAG